jgi:hypothetical protein
MATFKLYIKAADDVTTALDKYSVKIKGPYKETKRAQWFMVATKSCKRSRRKKVWNTVVLHF